jgi:Flp pilus assembly protein TadG
MRIHLSVLRREDGAVAVTVALFAVVLLVITAFTTDFGMAYAQRQALASGADSAALGIVRAEYTTEITSSTPRTCATIVSNDTVLASTIALAQINANAPFNATLVAADVTTTLSCVGVGMGILQVSVAVNRRVNPILGGLAGASSMRISRQAVAALGVVNGVKGVLPIAICTNEAQAIIAQHLADMTAGRADSAQLVSLTKVWGSGTQCDGTGTGTGNWGFLDFGKGVSATDLVSYINGSYPYTLTLPIPSMGGTPGDKNSSLIVAAMQQIMDKIVMIPVYNTVSGTGAGTTYSLIGFLSVQLCGYADNHTQAVGTCWDPATSVLMTNNSMQVRYVSYTPVGQMGQVCALGSSCAFNAYVTKLLG